MLQCWMCVEVSDGVGLKLEMRRAWRDHRGGPSHYAVLLYYLIWLQEKKI